MKHVKRRAKKLKVKLEVKGEEYTQSLSAPNRHLDSPHRAKIGKSIRDIDKLLNNQERILDNFLIMLHFNIREIVAGNNFIRRRVMSQTSIEQFMNYLKFF